MGVFLIKNHLFLSKFGHDKSHNGILVLSFKYTSFTTLLDARYISLKLTLVVYYLEQSEKHGLDYNVKDLKEKKNIFCVSNGTIYFFGLDFQTVNTNL